MPIADKMPAANKTLKALILGAEKSGKTDWAMRAAAAGFKVLFLNGDVAEQTLESQSAEAKSRIAFMDIRDELIGGVFKTQMIDTVAKLLTSTKYVWNDTQQREYSNLKDKDSNDEVWEIFPSRLDSSWVLVIDSWTTLAYSAMLDKANSLSTDLGDVEKVSREIYSGVGNRLTSILATLQKARFHVIVLGHPAEYAKKRAPDNAKIRDVKEIDMITEWTRMVPKSSSLPHGLTMGKFFSDVGWMDITRANKRELNFLLDNSRASGGHLNSKGDPRETHSFANLVKAIGGEVPDTAQPPEFAPALVIHEAGSYVPASAAQPKAPALGSTASATPTKVQGLGGLSAMLNKAKQ